MAREKTPVALDGLVYWAEQRNPRTARATVAACEALLNRGWGRATVPIEVASKIDLRNVLSTMSSEELQALRSLVNKLRGGTASSTTEPPSEEPPKTH